MAAELYPWNRRLATALVDQLPRLPHGLLLSGPAGVGKTSFAVWFAQFLLCDQPDADGSPCGQCRGCTLFAAGSHPDVHVIQPEAVYKSASDLCARYALRYPPTNKSSSSKDSTVIRIDQIRALIEDCQTRPQIAQRRVVLLAPADTLNVNAANSLLKLLEEPATGNYFLLVTHQPLRLPATIRSRCSRIEFYAPERSTARSWLESRGVATPGIESLLALAGCAPLQALALSESGFLAQQDSLESDLAGLTTGQGDPFACAARWKALGSDRCLVWLQGWLADLAALMLHADPPRLRNPALVARLHAWEKRLNLKRLFLFSETVAQSRPLLGGPLDELLILEDMLIRWTELSNA